MSIDQEPDSANTSTTDATTEPVDTAADQASQVTDTQDAEESSQTAPETDQQSSEGGSSTSSDTTLQTADQGGAPEKIDWQAEKAKYEKRIADLRAQHGRSSNDLHQLRKRYEGIDADAARKALEASRQVQPPIWNAKHPENRSFRETVAAFGRYELAMRKADTPEKRQFLTETMGASFTEKEVQQLQEWRNHQQRETERMASDPDAYREQIRAEVQEQIREEMRASREEAEVASWFGNQANQPIVERYRDEMIGLMNEGWHWPQVQRYIEAKAKADGLQSRVGSADQKAAQARAQSAALKSNATAKRDPAQAPIGKMDFAKIGADYAKKVGLPLNHERVLAHVEQAVANYRASNPQQ